MTFHIVSLFPESMDSYIKSSIIGRAVIGKKIKIKFYNPRDFVEDKHKRIDQKPYGGGPGMVIQAEPVIRAISRIMSNIRNQKPKIIYLTPRGKHFTNEVAIKFSKAFKHIIIIRGRYEGIDARVKKVFKGVEFPIGSYTLTGGELPALVIIDAVARQISGVLGNQDSPEEKRISSKNVYTRPESFKYKGKKYNVPKILLSGNHQAIENWKKGE